MMGKIVVFAYIFYLSAVLSRGSGLPMWCIIRDNRYYAHFRLDYHSNAQPSRLHHRLPTDGCGCQIDTVGDVFVRLGTLM